MNICWFVWRWVIGTFTSHNVIRWQAQITKQSHGDYQQLFAVDPPLPPKT
jgi:hypothetical protein